MTDRTTFLAERATGIGGSDAAGLFSIGYSCRRRLWYQKTLTPEDYPREGTTIMALGQVLEPFFADRYQALSGRAVTEQPKAFYHPEHPELLVHADRVILDEARGNGVLEIKSLGRATFYKTKREGLPEDYVLQLQHAMLVTGAMWGSFAIGSRDSGELIYWDVDKDPDICALILSEGPIFWREVQERTAPAALEPDDKRCQRCEYRLTCQGNALVQLDESGEMPQAEELRGLLSEYIDRKGLFAQAEELLEETTEELKTKLGDRQAVKVGERKIYFRPQEGRLMWDGKGLAAKYGHLREWALGHEYIDGKADASEYPPVEEFKAQSKPSRPLRVF